MPNKTEQSLATAKNRGIFLLPNLLTTAGLFSGFFAIVASMNGLFESAAVAIFIAMVFDGLDGRVARMTNTESAFGAEYDSMADIVSFGMAPALVMYNWGLSDLGKLGWLAAFIFVAGGALRLARFNTNLGTSDKRYFQGLAIPSAAAIVSGFVWVGSKYEIDPSNVSYIAAVLTIAAGLLMVSNFRYHSFKDVDWRDRVPFIAILLIVLAFVVVATEPSLVLFSIFLLYAISGPITTFRTVKKIKLEHVVGDSDCEESEEPTKKQQNSSETEPKSSAKSTTD
ncbi:CDP-diacylglycerol--serine O-phosphatidyltransferase [Pseudidiomarina tainanensis]|jgi:CDP-diacylglycerol--serine O-phosphatidyltransferase|uniref:CDP-diacylglycerol--serine O-phosphatidyltransferase n=2 Tax=Pseudidiomarina TaxID=2800384 RepID=A0A1I6HT89_9GAMM|nr:MULTISPECIES: CDP-diacylglycerol--serine O-phosphatidyltransferase [Pseudidiomarina]RZQ55422.1 CDP-diacylglycerol--serine O-phosphatidyltransferase [Pseudidiomarina tainanensis]SFR57617.1 CDP-diacylglycerol--serine O-phosphatidyltransferase [Pseudidiomarina maritima]